MIILLSIRTSDLEFLKWNMLLIWKLYVLCLLCQHPYTCHKDGYIFYLHYDCYYTVATFLSALGCSDHVQKAHGIFVLGYVRELQLCIIIISIRIRQHFSTWSKKCFAETMSRKFHWFMFYGDISEESFDRVSFKLHYTTFTICENVWAMCIPLLSLSVMLIVDLSYM